MAERWWFLYDMASRGRGRARPRLGRPHILPRSSLPSRPPAGGGLCREPHPSAPGPSQGEGMGATGYGGSSVLAEEPMGAWVGPMGGSPQGLRAPCSLVTNWVGPPGPAVLWFSASVMHDARAAPWGVSELWGLSGCEAIPQHRSGGNGCWVDRPDSCGASSPSRAFVRGKGTHTTHTHNTHTTHTHNTHGRPLTGHSGSPCRPPPCRAPHTSRLRWLRACLSLTQHRVHQDRVSACLSRAAFPASGL